MSDCRLADIAVLGIASGRQDLSIMVARDLSNRCRAAASLELMRHGAWRTIL